jgi:group I intron endonuclease
MKYVGQTTRTLKQRKSSHLSSSKKGSTYYLHRAIRKYGAENFKWEVIHNATSEEELNEKETYFIKEYNTNSQVGYNLTEGGRGIRGWKHSELTKEKIKQCAIKNNSAQYLKKFVQSEEGRKKISLMQLGKTYEMKFGKEKADEIIKEKQKSYIEKYGKQKTDIIRKKISNSNKSHLSSVKAKMSKSYKKRLDKSGKRTDITPIGRLGIKNGKLGDKNPNFKHINENVIDSLIIEYKSTKQITKEMILRYNLSKYLITRILKSKNIYERKR